MKAAKIPGFTAEAALGPLQYRSSAGLAGRSFASRGVAPQLAARSLSGVDLGAYLRCRANGGGDLVCRFFGGLPPFTIGGLLF